MPESDTETDDETLSSVAPTLAPGKSYLIQDKSLEITDNLVLPESDTETEDEALSSVAPT